MSTYDNWFATIKADRETFFYLNHDELDILQSYLQGDLALTDTVFQLTAPTQPQRYSDQAGRLWTVVLRLAMDHEEAQEGLVDLIRELFGLPPPPDSKHTNWAEEKEEGFPRSWRDTHDSLESDHLEAQLKADPVNTKWVNYHLFTARLIAANLLDGHYLALTLIVEALEKEAPLLDLDSEQESNIRAAAQYFIYAAKNMLHNPFQDKANATAYSTSWGDSSELWKGDKGFSLERWNFWKTRFGEIRVVEELDEETREASRRAEVAMDKSERQNEKGK